MEPSERRRGLREAWRSAFSRKQQGRFRISRLRTAGKRSPSKHSVLQIEKTGGGCHGYSPAPKARVPRSGNQRSIPLGGCRGGVRSWSDARAGGLLTFLRWGRPFHALSCGLLNAFVCICPCSKALTENRSQLPTVKGAGTVHEKGGKKSHENHAPNSPQGGGEEGEEIAPEGEDSEASCCR